MHSIIKRGLDVHANVGYAIMRPHIVCGSDVLPELSVRALSRIVSVFGGKPNPPGLTTVQMLYEELLARPRNMKFATCGALVRACVRLCF